MSEMRKVLITGCSGGGMGAGLAIAFHNAGLEVYATSRNEAKMANLATLGIKTMALDVLSESSIAECVAKIPGLDIWVNNAGIMTTMPVADLDIAEAKRIFDTNVWAQIAMTQAFLPLLIKSSNALIVNQSSVQATTAIPFEATYSASKAAFSMFSSTLRLELEPFNVKVVDLRTAFVATNLYQNIKAANLPLPEGSIYEPVKDIIEGTMDLYPGAGLPLQKWANDVVKCLLKKNLPLLIWKGDDAWKYRLAVKLPFGWLDKSVKKWSGQDRVNKLLRQYK